MPSHRTRNALWLIAYLAAMIALVWYLVHLRSDQIARLSNSAARQDWQTWREAARQQTGEQGPVQRKLPSSVEPPALVFLRDHFPVVVAAGLVFGSALFALLLFTVYGTLSSGKKARVRAQNSLEKQQIEGGPSA